MCMCRRVCRERRKKFEWGGEPSVFIDLPQLIPSAFRFPLSIVIRTCPSWLYESIYNWYTKYNKTHNSVIKGAVLSSNCGAIGGLSIAPSNRCLS